MNPQSPRPFDGDPLDRMLAQARWPEPSPNSSARLARHYHALRRRERLGRGIAGALAAAAAIAIVVGGSFWLVSESATTPDRASAKIVSRDPAPDASTAGRRTPGEPPVLGVRPTPDTVQVTGRPATAYELLMFTARERRRLRGDDQRPEQAEQIDSALARLSDSSDTDAAELAAGLTQADSGGDLEGTLIRRLHDERGPQAVAILRLLSEIGTDRSLPILRAAAGDPAWRSAAMPGLIRLADTATLAQLARGERDLSTRRRLLAALLGRDPAAAVPAFLPFVIERQTRSDALAALQSVDHPPIDELMARMDDPVVEVRDAAARALGRVADEATLARIAPLIDEPAHRRPALIALAESPHPFARQLLATATRDPSIASLCRMIETDPAIAHPYIGHTL